MLPLYICIPSNRPLQPTSHGSKSAFLERPSYCYFRNGKSKVKQNTNKWEFSSGISTVWLFIHCSRSNWNQEMIVFARGGKPENPEINPRSKTKTNSKLDPHVTPVRKSNPGHIGERRAHSPLRHSCSP